MPHHIYRRRREMLEFNVVVAMASQFMRTILLEALNAVDTMLYYVPGLAATIRCSADLDTNLYGLVLERALDLVQSDRMVTLLTPSEHIRRPVRHARFFSEMAGAKRVLALFDFENRRGTDDARIRTRALFPRRSLGSCKFCATVGLEEPPAPWTNCRPDWCCMKIRATLTQTCLDHDCILRTLRSSTLTPAPLPSAVTRRR